MPESRRRRVLRASRSDVWDLIADPNHQPRWWPGVQRMEGVHDDRFTQVHRTRRGRPVRLDFRIVQQTPPSLCVWSQEIPGTPFQRVLRESTIEIALAAVDDGTQVELTHRQKLRGYSRTGGLMLRRAMGRRLVEALEGLERVLG